MREEGSYVPFQKAILVSIRSLIGLYEELQQKQLAKYIITARLNQDYIEGCFGLVRGIGAFNLNPTAVDNAPNQKNHCRPKFFPV